MTVTDMSQAQAGIGIFVAGFGIGTKGKLDALNSCVSRIRFSVPVALPVDKAKQ